MDLIYSYPEINIDELCLSLESCNEMYLIDIMTESIDIRSISSKIKQVCSKIVSNAVNVILNIQNIIRAIITKYKIKHRLKEIKKILSKNPQIGYEEVKLRLEPRKTYDDAMKELNNISVMAKSVASNDKYKDALTKLEQTCSMTTESASISLLDAVDELEYSIDIFDSFCSECIKNMRNFNNMDFSQSDNPSKELAKVSKVSSIVAKSNSKLAKNIINNIDSVYKHTGEKINKIRNDCKAEVIAVKYNKAVKQSGDTNFNQIKVKPHHYVTYNDQNIPVFVSKGSKNDDFESPAAIVNMDGFFIVVTKKFLTYSDDIRQSIIMHELGHLANGHISIAKARDYERDLKNLKKYSKAYDKSELPKYSNDLSTSGTDDINTKGDVLVYLTKELEADRYSIKQTKSDTALSDALSQVAIDQGIEDSSKDLIDLRIKLMTKKG